MEMSFSELPYSAWIAAVAVVGAIVALVVRGRFTRASAASDAGAVSQTWLTEHKAGKSGRFT
jgi:hypothetical protein